MRESSQYYITGAGRKRNRTGHILLFVLFAFYSLLLIPSSEADEISARSAVVIDGATEKILYAKNPNLKQPPASTTKLLTAMVVLDKLNPESVLTVSGNAANVPSVSPHLRAGEKFTVKDILSLALMRSVNGAAVALAEAVAGSEDAFVALMNEKAARIGAENTRFINASGLPGPNQCITAFDLTKIMKESLKYPLIHEIIGIRTKDIYSSEGRRIFVKNTNQLLWTDDDFIGGKTGYTRAARHCFVSAAKKGQNTLITAVLGESIRSNLWEDSKTLVSKGNDIVAQKSEPMIYFSSANDRPVVLASYHPGKKHRISKARRVRQDNDSGTVVKKHKKKRSGQVKIARKGKRLSGRNIS